MGDRAIRVTRDGSIGVVTIDRPEVRNAVDRPTAAALDAAVATLDADETITAIVLTGAGGTFCSGADLKALEADPARANRVESDHVGPMGPTRRRTRVPVIAAVEGHAVAGGLELACWCDLRVAAQDAVFGVFCRRWGVPLVDGGTVRLPRLIGLSRALDLILTGRPVLADEALAIGLANRVVPTGQALPEAVALASALAAFPQATLQADRRSALESFDAPLDAVLMAEHARGVAAVMAGGMSDGLTRFAAGAGRGGTFDDR